MASALLHIKDSYYFEVPKSLWPATYSGKADFPEVWVRLDPQFQRWEAERLYDKYAELKEGDVVGKQELLSQYENWKHDVKHEGKPFARFLTEEHDQEWFEEHFAANRGASQAWDRAKEEAGSIEAFRETSIEWAPATVDAYNHHLSGKILIPQPFGGTLRNLYERESGICISKFMIVEVIVALLLWAIFSWLARQAEEGDRPRGKLWNLLEVFVVFIRDEVARPAIGKHDADRFVPLLLTFFFFVLGCNLMGMLPWLGAPTGSWGATAGLAVVTFGAVIVFGMKKFGPVGFFLNQVPSMELPFVLAIFLKPMIFAIELLSLCIKHAVLSIRLLANMVAGHIVLLGIMTLAFSVAGAMRHVGRGARHGRGWHVEARRWRTRSPRRFMTG